MPLFGRKPAEPPPPSQVPGDHPAPVASGPTGDLPCSHADCDRHDAVPCSYRDRRDLACQSEWCPEHYHLVQGAPYCRRHVSVARALTHHSAANALAPDLDNRAPSLCEWMAAAIGPRVEDALRQAAATRPGSRVLFEPLELALEGTPRMRYWERSWKLVDHTGPLAKLVIRVSEEDDRTVMAIAARRRLVEIVPPWIDRRATDDASREGFYASVVNSLLQGLDESLRISDVAGTGPLST